MGSLESPFTVKKGRRNYKSPLSVVLLPANQVQPTALAPGRVSPGKPAFADNESQSIGESMHIF